MLFKRNDKLLMFFILLIIFALVLTACSSSSPVEDIENEETLQDKAAELTEEGDFEGVVNLLNTPERLINYESRHFEHYLDKYDERPEGFVEFTPRKMFDEQVGSCSSFSVFESYVLSEHNFEVFTLYYISELEDEIYGHTITIYEDDKDQYRYLTNIGDSEFEIYGPYSEIDEILLEEEKRTGYEIFYHGYVDLGYTGEQVEIENYREAVDNLETIQPILNYIARDFELDNNNNLNPIRSYEEMFQEKRGTRQDLFSLISQIMDQNGYEVNILKYRAEINNDEITNCLIVYKDNDGYWRSIISYTGSEPLYLRSVRSYSNINELLDHVEVFEDTRRDENYTIIEYGLIDAGADNFTINEWINL